MNRRDAETQSTVGDMRPIGFVACVPRVRPTLRCWVDFAIGEVPPRLAITRSVMATRLVGAVLLVLVLSGVPVLACPFCTALKPTLCERRETAAVAVLAEFVADAGKARTFRVHRSLSDKPWTGAETIAVAVDWQGKPGGLAVLFGEGDADAALEKLEWSAVRVNETSFAYLAQAPSLRKKGEERLAYFVRFLEHADAAIADDVYQEFGHAPLEDIAKIADRLPFEKLRAWLVDREIPQERKGFFGVALGLATNEDDRRANLAVLRRVMDAKESDFRAGFDGVLGGYLLLEGERGLSEIGRRYFADKQAAEGDVRHAIAAVRFFYEHDQKIDRERFRAALRPLVDRPEFAGPAVLDLARWKDWSLVAKAARLYDAKGYPQPSTREAVVAYLLACPEREARSALAEIRRRDPDGAAAAELKVGPIAPAGPR